MNSQIARFLLVGFTTVGIDFVVYFACTNLLPIAASKAIGFISGSLFAYFANKTYTFQSDKKHSKSLWRFCLAYMSTLLINVVLNDVAIFVLGSIQFVNIWAFLIATSVSALTNFILLKFFVFYTSQQDDPL